MPAVTLFPRRSKLLFLRDLNLILQNRLDRSKTHLTMNEYGLAR